ncbi:MAG: hypothetical protein OXU20_42195 [Myxococcales bacterium]|nr:hypothetical protein [Myxococcales bacterium]MDD9972084.1 hypothetical protein [Myxococcales bacterium]
MQDASGAAASAGWDHVWHLHDEAQGCAELDKLGDSDHVGIAGMNARLEPPTPAKSP